MNLLVVHRNHLHTQWQHCFLFPDRWHLQDHVLQMKATKEMAQ